MISYLTAREAFSPSQWKFTLNYELGIGIKLAEGSSIGMPAASCGKSVIKVSIIREIKESVKSTSMRPIFTERELVCKSVSGFVIELT